MILSEICGLAMSLPEVTEEPHFECTSFRVRGRIFATAPPGGEYLHVFVADEEREAALAEAPDFLEPLRWGRPVSGVRVLLHGAKTATVRTLLVQAWSRQAPRRLAASFVL